MLPRTAIGAVGHSFISNCAARGVDQRLINQWVRRTTEVLRRRYRPLPPAVSQAALLRVFGSPGGPRSAGRRVLAGGSPRGTLPELTGSPRCGGSDEKGSR